MQTQDDTGCAGATEIARQFLEGGPKYQRWNRLLAMLAEYRADIAASYQAEIDALRAELARSRRAV